MTIGALKSLIAGLDDAMRVEIHSHPKTRQDECQIRDLGLCYELGRAGEAPVFVIVEGELI